MTRQSLQGREGRPATGTEPVVPLALDGFTLLYSGKVRELYAPLDQLTGQIRQDVLLLVATDRISAYDFILDTEIPDKGKVLTQLSQWWFEQLADIVPNHLISAPLTKRPGLPDLPEVPEVPEAVAGRAVLVKRVDMLPVECIGRAYLTGSGLTEYRQSSSVCGVGLPSGLQDGSRLPSPIFTPTTKAPIGQHDEPMTFAEVESVIGMPVASQVRDLTLAILQRGNDIAADRGILLADTKVEFGLDTTARGGDGTPAIVLADEVLTPDSSRFWRASTWQPGQAQESYDKQFVRDWLVSPASGWDRSSGKAPPALPDGVVQATRAKYIEAFESLTGRTFV